MSGSRYGEPRQRAQLELRAAVAQFVVDAELMVRWLDQLGGEPAPAHALEERHAEVLRRARCLEAALNHVVSLELLAAERPPDAPPADAPAAGGPPAEGPRARHDTRTPATEPEPKTRRTIAIVGHPDTPKPDTGSGHPSPPSGDIDDTEEPGLPEPSGSA